MALIGRILIILIAFFAANFFAVNVLMAGKVLVDFDNFRMYSQGLGYLLAALVGTLFSCLTTLLPATIVISIAEIAQIRARRFYSLLGASGGLLFDLACTRFEIIQLRSFCRDLTLSEIIIATVAGAVAGLVYWQIAGRNAGLMRPVGGAVRSA
jgi:hypothetical protein